MIELVLGIFLAVTPAGDEVIADAFFFENPEACVAAANELESVAEEADVIVVELACIPIQAPIPNDDTF